MASSFELPESLFDPEPISRMLGTGASWGLVVIQCKAHGKRPKTYPWKSSLFAVSLILHGLGRYYDNKKGVYRLAPGTLYQRFPNCTDRIEIDPGSDFAEFYLVIDGEIYKALKGLRIIPQARVFDVGINQRVVEEFAKLRGVCQLASDKITRRLLVTEVVDFLSSLYERSELKPGEGYWPGVVHDAARLLESNLYEPCRLPDVARKLRVSYTSLRRAFREHLGVSLGDYRIQKRIDATCDLLANHSVKDTAGLLGYCDPFAFSAQFKKQTGTSPSAFRRDIRKRMEFVD